MYIKVIACEVFFREICYCASISKNIIDLEFLPHGYHDTPEIGFSEIQRRVDATPAGKYDAIVLGYGLCSKITNGLVARNTQVVIPKVHDCIAIFMGSRKRYNSVFESNPGTYYYTSGWIECLTRRGGKVEFGNLLMPASAKEGVKIAFQELEKKYGKENAAYLISEFERWTNIYTRGVLIKFDFARPLNLEEKVREICQSRGWDYGEMDGDLSYIQRLLDGDWNEEDFLILKPNEKAIPSYDDNVLGKEPAG
jgi:hypothetical protein